MAELLLSHFEGHVGEAFELTCDAGVQTLKLAEATALAAHTPADGELTIRDGGPFSIVFEGDGAAPLEQGIYAIRHPDLGALNVFLVPIAHARYESIFN